MEHATEADHSQASVLQLSELEAVKETGSRQIPVRPHTKSKPPIREATGLQPGTVPSAQLSSRHRHIMAKSPCFRFAGETTNLSLHVGLRLLNGYSRKYRLVKETAGG